MFTPEFVSSERGEYVFVANHSLSSADGIHISIAYNRARAGFGAKHLPPHIQKCRVVYDVRGQNVSTDTKEHLRQTLQEHCILEFKE